MNAIFAGAVFLAAFIIAAWAATLVSAAVWRIVGRRTPDASRSLSANAIFCFRVAPVAFAFGFVALAVVPAFFIFEPDNSGESVGAKLGVAASFGAFCVLLALFQAGKKFLRTRRLIADWMLEAQPLKLEAICPPSGKASPEDTTTTAQIVLRSPARKSRRAAPRVQAFVIDCEFPTVALAGILRPRLFISRNVLAALDPGEASAALRHELAHLAARDNLKRAILEICRNLLLVAPGRSIDKAWAFQSETEADRAAVADSAVRSSVSLASALLKIARLVPPIAPGVGRQTGALLSNFGSEPSLIRRRVMSLVDSEGAEKRCGFRWSVASSGIFVAMLLAAAMLAPALLLVSGNLAAVHELTEKFVRLLS
jgi:Zn-dependent protease with chaperone function